MEYLCGVCGRVTIAEKPSTCGKCGQEMITPRRAQMKKYWKKVKKGFITGASYVMAAPFYVYYKVRGVKW